MCVCVCVVDERREERAKSFFCFCVGLCFVCFFLLFCFAVWRSFVLFACLFCSFVSPESKFGRQGADNPGRFGREY